MNLKEIATKAIEEAEKQDNDGYDMSEPVPVEADKDSPEDKEGK